MSSVDPMAFVYFGLFIALVLFEVPIMYSMLFSSVLYAIQNHQSFILFAQKMSASFADFSLLAVPAFLFVGAVMNEVGLTDRIFGFASKWIGHLPGGLAHANIIASMIFAGMSGSAMADAGGLGTIEVKAMREAGYDDEFAVAVTAASSTVGPIIPPSINFVVWAFMTGSSTMVMFLAGLVPGLLMGVAMMAWVVFCVKKLHYKAPLEPKASWKERYQATLKAIPAMGGPILLIGGILSGVFTPTECGVVAGAYCVLLSIVYRKFNIKMIWRTFKNTLSSSAMTMAMCAAGLVFNWMIVTSGMMTAVAGALLSFGNKYVILIMLNILLLICGCFMSAMSTIIMFVPLLTSLCSALGISMVQIGVVAVLNMMIGLITPPLAGSLFVTCKISGVNFNRALKKTLPFMIPLCTVLLLISFIPELTLWLPRVLGYLR